MTNRVRATLISVSLIVMFYALVGALLGKNNNSTEKTYRDLGVYSEVLNRIRQEYVTEPDMKKVTDGAIHGLLESLDPYSTYFTAEQYQAYLQHPEPGPADVGVFLSKRMGYATVVAVLPGSPAEKAGVKPGDLIDEIDKTPARELSVLQLEHLLAGQAGTNVTVSVVREARSEPQSITVTRAILNYPPVVTKMADEGTGYLRVASFNKGKAQEISAKLKELEAQGARKIVLDLRNCAGGDVQEAVDTASLFLDKGLVTYISGQRFPRQDLEVHPRGSVSKLPLAVLINQSTAGPSELVASAVIGNKRGEVVGVRSFGVGVFQKPIPVGDGSALLLSVAKYYGSDGKAIDDNGVTPTVVQSATNDTESPEDEGQPEGPENFGGKDDLQLRKAMEILNQPATTLKAT
jgi:carboxyl-terminal processing protease